MAPQTPSFSPNAGKRNPTVLVTDSREHRRPVLTQRPTARLVTVDSVLQYASDIPSAQQRFPGRPRVLRTPSGRPNEARLTGRFAPPHLQHMPPRTTKTSEKLVLLPETPEDSEEDSVDKADFDEDNDVTPLRDDERSTRTGPAAEKKKSYAERLPKSRRTEKLSRCTAYCTAQAYKMKSIASFVKERHGARTKLYDDCLYAAYHLPLLPGNDGYRIRSSPIIKSPGGKAFLDEEIERNEMRDYHEGYFSSEFEDEEQHSVVGSPRDSDHNDSGDVTPTENGGMSDDLEQKHRRQSRSRRSQKDRQHSPPRIAPQAFTVAEAFIFSYGVVVFWNFSEKQEKDVLADLTFSSSPTSPSVPIALSTAPLDEEDFETEEFHFEYSTAISRPRVYNDMITLRSGDHMIKLAISHAIAQSTKLSYFEEEMTRLMGEAKDVPRRLALTGKLGMTRKDVFRILGALYKNRVDVNLSSNILAVPEFFWESEPTLHPLYSAIREYLEIKPRIQVLNERCRVFLDLAEILSDSISDNKMSRLTEIIIVLICVSILVTCSEVFLRFGLLSASKNGIGGGQLGDGVNLATKSLVEGAMCVCSSGQNGTWQYAI